MHTSHPLIRNSGIALFAVASLILSACSGMTQQEKNTAIGAGVGAIGGSILTGGGFASAIRNWCGAITPIAMAAIASMKNA